ncbi:MAG: hypothetical protein QOE61_1822, partial [Micromonosporaceae bacterium]|nr:hypothetical protein [Micromonosporaceae bacterium]
MTGRALRDGGLVVDLSGLRRVEVDPQARTATVAGGATTGDVVAAGRPYALAVPTGVVRAVGMAGLTLAGGYGPLNGRYGLALDNLLSAELVLADGRRVTASPDADAELFWAIRGGGGNFGVVTGLTYRLHPLATVLAGMIMFPLVQAASVLRGYGAFLAAGPDEITVMAGFLCGPDGQTVLFLCPFYSGEDLRTGERLIASLQSLGKPVMSQIAPMAYDDALGMFDNGMADGNHYQLRTRWLPALSEEAAEVLIDTAGRITSPHSGLALHHFHGAATRPDRGDTAFALREEHLLVEIIAAWTSSEADGVHREWADRASRLLAPMSLPGGYPNLLGPDDHERVRLSYQDAGQCSALQGGGEGPRGRAARPERALNRAVLLL